MDASSQTFVISATAVNDPPVANDDAFGPVAEGGTLTQTTPTVLANDTDVEDTTLNAVLVTGPASPRRSR